MAHLIPPYGPNCAIILTHDEALTLLALLNVHASYANRPIRDVLTTYLERTRED